MYDDARLVKKAYSKVKYTPEQIDELVGCMDPEHGPMYFMKNFMYIQHPVRGRLKFDPYDYQDGLVDSYHNYKYSIAMIGRQLGKTTVAAGYLLWYAMFIPDSFILIASKSGADAKEIMQRVRYAYESVPDHIRSGVTSYNKHSIDFDNGSRILSTTTTENTGRGLSLSLVYLDEFAFVEPRIAKELWTSLSPTLSTGGKCIITSTPNTDEDQFAQLWFNANQLVDEYGNERETGSNSFKPFFATWQEHPDRDEQWAKEERGKIGEERFRREHECEFISFEETLINPVKLLSLQSSNPIRKTGQVRWFKNIDPNCTYVVGLDPAMGSGGDNAAIEVIELPTMLHVAEWQHNRTPIEGQMRVLKQINSEILSHGDPELYWSIESNTIGEAAMVVIRDTGEEHFGGTMLHDPIRATAGGRRKKGFCTTNKSKLEGCSKLKTLIEKNKISIASRGLISELKNFVAKGNSYEARVGTTDDLVMAMILIMRMIQYVAMWDDETNANFGSNILDEDEFLDEYDSPMPLLIM